MKRPPEREATIATSPDGHGGSLKVLYKSGALTDMKKRGIEYISYFQIDNPLVKIFDPLFIGLHSTDNAEMSSKALIKSGPMERVGNFCVVDGRVTVIEYSDLPDELAYKKNTDGSLAFELGSNAIHIINTDFVEKLNKDGFSLPIHRALKKIPFINQQGIIVEPAEPRPCYEEDVKDNRYDNDIAHRQHPIISPWCLAPRMVKNRLKSRTGFSLWGIGEAKNNYYY